MSKAQQQIPGTERTSIPELDECAENYRAYRDERMALQAKENLAQTDLVAKMKAHNQTVYRYEDNNGESRKVVLSDIIKAKVAKVRDSDRTEEGGS